jgi:hypothetical protein
LFDLAPITEGQDTLSSTSDGSQIEGPNAISQLSMLISEIHETISTMSSGPWVTVSDSNDLDNYPVGHVLNLAQEFVAALSNICSSTSTSAGRYGSSASMLRQFPTANQANYLSTNSLLSKDSIPKSQCADMANTTDIPTKLLALSCYISLRRLYILVFSHLERYVSLLPQPIPRRASNMNYLVYRRSLQLGQLPSAYEMCGKIYTAVQMLFDMFQSVEELLRYPDSLTMPNWRMNGDESPECSGSDNTTFWTLLQSELSQFALRPEDNIGTNSSDPKELGELGELGNLLVKTKAQALKALLREKMN